MVSREFISEQATEDSAQHWSDTNALRAWSERLAQTRAELVELRQKKMPRNLIGWERDHWPEKRNKEISMRVIWERDYGQYVEHSKVKLANTLAQTSQHVEANLGVYQELAAELARADGVELNFPEPSSTENIE